MLDMKRIIIEEPTPVYDEKGDIKYYQDDEYVYIPYKSKKQEWSEEDIKKIRSEEYTKGFNDCLLGKQKGWNEEDEKMLSKIIKHFDWYDSDHFNAEDCKEAQDFLKSLRPPQDRCKDCPHRGDMFLLTQGVKSGKHDLAIKFMNHLDENRPEGKMGLSNSECEDIDKAFKESDWATILRYAEKYSPSWKPSEEQMEALRRAVNKLAKSDVADSVRLSIMYDNLKKLI